MPDSTQPAGPASDGPVDPAAASLDRLHDLVVPEGVPWWPVAPGWWVLAGLLLAGTAMVAWRAWRRRLRNAYRREALALIDRLESAPPDSDEACVSAVSTVLKRAALTVWPRAEVASLSGEAWLRFLDRTAGVECFTAGAGCCLGEGRFLADRRGAVDLPALLEVARLWIARHDPAASARGATAPAADSSP